MITDLDKKKSSNIDFEEFLDMMTARMSDKDTREDITKVSRLFDDDGTGKITLKILEGLLRSSVRR
jgi:Ca2+-binding EF-hand superfamily protein